MTATNGNGNGNGHGEGRYTMRYLAQQFLDLFENHWCAGPTAMDVEGREVDVDDSAAVRWCSDGALRRAEHIAHRQVPVNVELLEALGRFEEAWGMEAQKEWSGGFDDRWAAIFNANESGGLPAVRKILKAVAAK